MTNREKAIANLLAQWEAEFHAGDIDRFLKAMQLCLTFDLPIPDWAAWHFMAGAQRYGTAEARTLDEAFGVQRSKGWQQSKARGRRGRGLIAYVKMRYLTQGGMPVRDAIADIAEQMHMTESTAERWYYDDQLIAELGRPQGSKNSEDA